MTEVFSPSKLYVPALAPLYNRLSEWSYPFARFVIGAVLVPHGMQKLFGAFGGGGLEGTVNYFAKIGLHPSHPLAYLVTGIEFFGGICIAIGFLTRPAALLFAVEMMVASFYVHLPNGFFWSKGGLEYPLLWGLLALAIVVRGGGKYSVDAKIGKEF